MFPHWSQKTITHHCFSLFPIVSRLGYRTSWLLGLGELPEGIWADLTLAKSSGDMGKKLPIDQQLIGVSPITIPETIAGHISAPVPFSFLCGGCEKCLFHTRKETYRFTNNLSIVLLPRPTLKDNSELTQQGGRGKKIANLV